MSLPTLFIGSSSEGRAIATEIARQLRGAAAVTVWDEGVFRLGESFLDSLRRALNLFDFALLVVSPDDVVTSRHKQQAAPRDNVVFELGLFIGNLGPRRSFYICSKQTGQTLKLPSDLAGISALQFEWNGKRASLAAALKPAMTQLKAVIRERSTESEFTMLPSTSLAIGYFKNFVLEVCRELMRCGSAQLDGKSVDVSKGDFDFFIVLPERLSEAGHDGLRKIKKTHQLKDIKIQCGSREFPFFAKVALRGRRVAFYDSPTTLRSSWEAICFILKPGPLGDDVGRGLLEQREIANFEQTLRRLLQQPEAAEFAGNIKIIRLGEMTRQKRRA